MSGPLPYPAPPTREDLQAARDRTIQSVLGRDLIVLFCGINPGLYSGATGWHFARPGNRFWRVLQGSGFTDRVLHPSEQHVLPHFGLGITNLVDRATASAAELSDDELRAGGERLRALAREWTPEWLAVVGVSAYRVAFGDPAARVGRQEVTIDATKVWVLPNPSGLDAHYQLPALTAAFAELREVASRAAGAGGTPSVPPGGGTSGSGG